MYLAVLFLYSTSIKTKKQGTYTLLDQRKNKTTSKENTSFSGTMRNADIHAVHVSNRTQAKQVVVKSGNMCQCTGRLFHPEVLIAMCGGRGRNAGT